MNDVTSVKKKFEHLGISVAEWARQRGFSESLVHQILSGKRTPKRGQSHQIAVALGLKPGDIGCIEDLENNLGVRRKANE